MRYVGRAIPAEQTWQRDELWQALEFLHTSHFATPIAAGNKAAVPVQPVLKVMAKHLRGEQKLRHATVTAILSP
jgi:bifunctional non-homologous end joining protein LigD